MKKSGIILSIAGIIAAGSYCYAVTIGQRPSAVYINNLVNCKISTIKGANDTTHNGIVTEYKINGETSDGRCKVTITSYADYSNPQTYKDAVSVMKLLKADKIPTQAEMIKNAQAEKDVSVCKFTPQQVAQLYYAYQKK